MEGLCIGGGLFITGKKQIESIDDGIIVKDDIEYGHGNVVPLWQFGLIY
jgi:hypothetical protein